MEVTEAVGGMISRGSRIENNRTLGCWTPMGRGRQQGESWARQDMEVDVYIQLDDDSGNGSIQG